MSQLEIHDPSLETQGLTAQDSMLRKILEGKYVLKVLNIITMVDCVSCSPPFI